MRNNALISETNPSYIFMGEKKNNTDVAVPKNLIPFLGLNTSL